MSERQPIVPDLDSNIKTLEEFAGMDGNTFFPDDEDFNGAKSVSPDMAAGDQSANLSTSDPNVNKSKE